MDIKKLFIAICASLVTYALSSALLGQSGFFAMKELKQERDRLSANMGKLRVINSELKDTLDALRSDTDSIAVHAREIGYASEGERFLRIEGLAPGARRPAPVGNLLSAQTPFFIPDYILRIAAFLTGISVLILSLGSFLRIPKYHHHTRPDHDLSR